MHQCLAELAGTIQDAIGATNDGLPGKALRGHRGFGHGTRPHGFACSTQAIGRQQKKVHFVLVGVYSFEISEQAKKVEANLAALLGWKLNQRGDASNILDVIRANTATWSGSQVLLFARVPEPQQCSSVASDDDRSVLHNPNLRLV